MQHAPCHPSTLFLLSVADIRFDALHQLTSFVAPLFKLQPLHPSCCPQFPCFATENKVVCASAKPHFNVLNPPVKLCDSSLSIKTQCAEQRTMPGSGLGRGSHSLGISYGVRRWHFRKGGAFPRLLACGARGRQAPRRAHLPEGAASSAGRRCLRGMHTHRRFRLHVAVARLRDWRLALQRGSVFSKDSSRPSGFGCAWCENAACFALSPVGGSLCTKAEHGPRR